jgi:hypothetical protein
VHLPAAILVTGRQIKLPVALPPYLHGMAVALWETVIAMQAFYFSRCSRTSMTRSILLGCVAMTRKKPLQKPQKKTHDHRSLQEGLTHSRQKEPRAGRTPETTTQYQLNKALPS